MKKRTIRLGRLVACIMMLWSMTACAAIAQSMFDGDSLERCGPTLGARCPPSLW